MPEAHDHLQPFSPGCTQPGRWMQALHPATAPLDDRSPSDLLGWAHAFAQGLRFFEDGNDWTAHLPDASKGLGEAVEAARLSPSHALFLVWLRFYRAAQRELNGLTGRHLEFFYKQVLGLAPATSALDHTDVVLSLKKTASEVVVPRGTVFVSKAGDRFASSAEVAINHAAIVHHRLITGGGEGDKARFAPVANSADGLGSPLLEHAPGWHPLGVGASHLPEMPLGFAVSAPVLWLVEGTRTLNFLLTLAVPKELKPSVLTSTSFTASASGAKDWLPLDARPPEIVPVKEGVVQLKLTFVAPSRLGPVLPFNPGMLDGAFDTLAPVVRVHLSSDAPLEVRAWLQAAEIKSVKISVKVEGMEQSLDLENDLGRLDQAKPFMPFGPLPRVGVSFYIDLPEALGKHVTSASLRLAWHNPPNKLDQRAAFSLLEDGSYRNLAEATPLFASGGKSEQLVPQAAAASMRPWAGLRYKDYAAAIGTPLKLATLPMPFSDALVHAPLPAVPKPPVLARRQVLQAPDILRSGKLRLQILPATFARRGLFRLRLLDSFGHEDFAARLTQAVRDETALPSPPWTPELEKCSLDYEAESDEVSLEDSASYQDRELRFFHLGPFGQREEHRAVREASGVGAMPRLLPEFASSGELLLGFSGLVPGASVSLLFLLEEGTANPLAKPPVVRWSVLGRNHWQPLQDGDVVVDNSGLLRSGVIRLVIPLAATLTSTFLEPGLLWLRATVEGDPAGVCRLLQILPNGVPVARLADPAAMAAAFVLPAASLAAAVPPLPPVKSVLQPVASAGGRAAETETGFRRRASERLRHRGRAITPWDFERLVLEAFPSIYQVRVLTQTNRSLKFQAGAVTLVVVPDIRAQKVFDPLQPMARLDLLADIEAFLRQAASPHAVVAAINPVFEPVQLSVKVCFRKGCPPVTYASLLDQDLRRHLAPWSHDQSVLPSFGNGVRRSELIAFIDSRPGVDFVEGLSLLSPGSASSPASEHEVLPSSAAAILTSALHHAIEGRND